MILILFYWIKLIFVSLILYGTCKILWVLYSFKVGETYSFHLIPGSISRATNTFPWHFPTQLVSKTVFYSKFNELYMPSSSIIVVPISYSDVLLITKHISSGIQGTVWTGNTRRIMD
jgi:hypothetical protein